MKTSKILFTIILFLILLISFIPFGNKTYNELDKIANIDKSTIILKKQIIDSNTYNKVMTKVVVNFYEYKNYKKDSVFPIEHYVEIKVYNKQNQKWTLNFNFIEVLDCMIIEEPYIIDFNSDGFKDIVINCCVWGRGSNMSKNVFLFNKKINNYLQISNSDNFCNLYYNKFTQCYASFYFTGGYDYELLKLKDNRLYKIAGVSSNGIGIENSFIREVYLINKNEEYITMQIDTIKVFDDFIFDNIIYLAMTSTPHSTFDSLIFQYLKK